MDTLMNEVKQFFGLGESEVFVYKGTDEWHRMGRCWTWNSLYWLEGRGLQGNL